MPFRLRRSLSLLSLLFPAITAATLLAQSNAEINARIQFNFSPPGARSLALGGAFLALADDATTAYTNPAGLTNLSRPELSIEGRVSRFTNTFLFGGRSGGSLTNTGVDTVNHEVDSSSKDTTHDLSFLSLVYPGKNWAVAVYRHELANFEASAKTQGAFFGGSDHQGIAYERRLFPVIATLDLRIVNYGLGFAYRFGEAFSLGFGVSRFDYTQNTNLTRYDFNSTEAPNYNSSNAVSRQRDHGDDHAVAVNAGMLWKVSPHVAVGAVYRQGPRFDITSSYEPIIGASPLLFAGTFHVPDVFGAGISFQPLRPLTLSFDYDRVRYSQLGSNTVDVFGQGSTFASSDGNEYHFGAQYRLQLGASVLAFRAGAWREPAHSLVATSVDANSNDDRDTVIRKHTDSFLFREGSSRTHYTGGLGVAIGEHFQLDVGGDYAKDSSKIGSLSLVVRL
jgi:long-subunit fatty acid transport protein